METKNMIGSIVALAVVVICVAAIMMPVLSEATKTQETFENAGYLRMSEIDTTGTYVVAWDITAPNTITVNGASVEMDLTTAPSRVTVCFDDDWMLRANISSGNVASISFVPNGGASTVASSTMEVTLAEGTVTAVMDSTTRTEDYTAAYIPDADGQYIMKESSTNAYLHSDSMMIAFGMSRVGTAGGYSERGITFEGSISDGVTPTLWRPPTDTTSTITDVSINATQNTDYVDLYELSNITMVCNFVNDDETVTETTLTYSYFLVPAEVTSELSSHLNSGQIAILNAIPAMIIVALIIAALGTFYIKRSD